MREINRSASNHKKIKHFINTKKLILVYIASLLLLGCSKQKTLPAIANNSNTIMQKKIDKKLPTIGILIFEDVIINEVVAPLDVFANTTPEGKSLFNVVLIAKENKVYKSAHGLNVLPHFTIDNVPDLKVLVIPSSYTPSEQTSDKTLVHFIKEQNKTTDYIASHCAGAFLVGEAGIATSKNIVTYVTGGASLQVDYPHLKVADDSKISVLEDGKFISSNGSLVSYIASLDLLEKLVNKEQRNYVEESLLLDRLKEN